jgi:hypothetical protein
MLIRALFGVRTWSIYGDAHDIGANSELSELVGHASTEKMSATDLEEARSSDRVHFVKTHDVPPPSGKKIYIVRDGRAAIVSQKYYEANYSLCSLTLPELVMGYCFRGGWSDHIAAWIAQKDTSTLVLRYEDLISVEQLSELVERIERFSGIPRKGLPAVDFERLKAIEPKFFRAGCNEPGVAEMESTCPNLFWHLHGKAMVDLGYAKDIPHVDYSRLVAEIAPAIEAIRQWAPSQLRFSATDIHHA